MPNNRQGMAMLSVLLALVIVGIMFYYAWNTAKKKPENANKSFVREAGIDTSNYKTILDSTKQVVNKAVATRQQDPLK